MIFIIPILPPTQNLMTPCTPYRYHRPFKKQCTIMTSNGGANLLDLAFVSQTSQLNQCEVIPPIGNSDHCGPIIDWKWKPSYSHPRSRLNRRQIWRYAYADFDKANEMLSNTAQIGIS